MTRKRIRKETVDQINFLRVMGKSYDEIANELKISKHTAHKYGKNPPVGYKRRLIVQQADEIKALKKEKSKLETELTKKRLDDIRNRRCGRHKFRKRMNYYCL